MVDLSVFGSLGSFKAGLVGLASYIWVLYIFVPLAVIIFIGYLWKMSRDNKRQWTHILRVKRELTNGSLSKEDKIKMKRFPLIKNASVFRLERPLLGSYLCPELDSYTGFNEFSVVIGNDNRIYINTGEKFCRDSSSINVSAKHAGIDLAFEDLKGDWQNINKVEKKLEWAQVAKFMMLGLLIIAVMVVSIKGIGQWGENHQIDAQKASSEAEAFRQLAEAMKTSESVNNGLILTLDLLKTGYGTNNLQNIIQEKTNGTIQ